MNNILSVNNLSKVYIQKSNKNSITALNKVNFNLSKGTCLGVIGESGCGKSTLGKLLVNLEKPTDGTIIFNNVNLDEYIKKNTLGFRKQCQMIFQNPFDTFDPRLNIKKILIDTIKLHKICNSNTERLELCIKIMEKSGLKPAKDFLDRYPHELSGGQLQRIAIIRSMLLEPLLLIADEPVSMLDVSVRADIINMFIDLKNKNHTSMIFISHDIATTSYVADEMAVMYLGNIVEFGNTADIIYNSKHPYTKVLLSNCGSIDVKKVKERIKICGDPTLESNNKNGCIFANRCFMSNENCKNSSPKFEEVDKNHFVKCHYFNK